METGGVEDLKLGLVEKLRLPKQPKVGCVVTDEPRWGWMDEEDEEMEEPVEWKEIRTLGHPSKRKILRYRGSSAVGATLDQSGNPHISAELFGAALVDQAVRTLKGGFSMDNPPPDGFGQWVLDRSKSIGGQRALTPRHGSFIAAILVHEAGMQSRLDGNTVWLTFPKAN